MPDKLKKQGRQMATGKSEGRIVPLKPGNSGGGKAAERLSQVGKGIVRPQFRTRGDNRTSLQNAAASLLREGSRGEPDALTVHVRFWEGTDPN